MMEQQPALDSASSESRSSSSSTNEGDAVPQLEVWQEVHSSLLHAIRKSQAGIAVEKAQRRFWLEEIAANLNEDGTLKNKSIWQRPAPLLRHTVGGAAKKAAAASSTGSKKRKKNNDTAAADKTKSSSSRVVRNPQRKRHAKRKRRVLWNARNL